MLLYHVGWRGIGLEHYLCMSVAITGAAVLGRVLHALYITKNCQIAETAAGAVVSLFYL